MFKLSDCKSRIPLITFAGNDNLHTQLNNKYLTPAFGSQYYPANYGQAHGFSTIGHSPGDGVLYAHLITSGSLCSGLRKPLGHPVYSCSKHFHSANAMI